MKYEISWYCAGSAKPVAVVVDAESLTEAQAKLGDALTRLLDPGSVAKSFKDSLDAHRENLEANGGTYLDPLKSPPEFVINFGNHLYFIEGRNGTAPFAEAHRFKTEEHAKNILEGLPSEYRKVAAVLKVPTVCHPGASCSKSPKEDPTLRWRKMVDDLRTENARLRAEAAEVALKEKNY